MTPSELRAAAERVIQTYVTDPEMLGVHIHPTMTELASVDCARYILATVRADDGEPVTELDTLRAEVAALREELEVSQSAAAAEARLANELRAELTLTPPTLEWLRATLGSQPTVVVSHTGWDNYRWSCGVTYHTGQNRVTGPTGLTLKTRAAVLAAVEPKENDNDPR